MEIDLIYDIILLVLEGDASKEELDTLHAWLEESPDNQKKYDKIRRIHEASRLEGNVHVFHFDLKAGWEKVYSKTIAKKKTLRLRRIMRYAAAVMLLLSVGTAYFLANQKEKYNIVTLNDSGQLTILTPGGEEVLLGQNDIRMEQIGIVFKNDGENSICYEENARYQNKRKKRNKNKLVVPTGYTFQVVLCDGTRIRLNSESSLVYPNVFSKNKREVELRGEAYFEVAGDEKKPFYVHANGMKIKVLGTSFNVSAYETDPVISTTLVKGSVSVLAGNSAGTVLSPSERFIYNKESEEVMVEQVDTEIHTSWMSGQYVFKESPLEEIINKLQRWYGFTVNYQNDDLKKLRFSMTIDCHTPLCDLVELINYTTEIEITLTDHVLNIRKEVK